MSNRGGLRSDRGLTIVELLVSIGIVAVLLSLVLPPLSRARGAARQAVSGSNLRQIYSIFVMYTKDSSDLYPAIIEGRAYQIDELLWVNYPYWQIATTWPGVIYDAIAINREPGVFISPGSRREGFPSSYVYSTSFVGSPLLWRPGAAALPEYQHGQRTSGVVYPSAKALLWDEELGFLQKEPRRIGGDLAEGAPLAAADGSVQTRTPAFASDPVPNGFRHPLDHQRLHNTKNGVAGSDY